MDVLDKKRTSTYGLFRVCTPETAGLDVAGSAQERVFIAAAQQAHGPLHRHLRQLVLRLPVEENAETMSH